MPRRSQMPPGVPQVIYKKWSNTGEDAEYLRDLYEEGEIQSDTAPKTVWESHDRFQQYKLDSFRSALNRVRKDYFGPKSGKGELFSNFNFDNMNIF